MTDYKISVQNQDYSDNPESSICGLFSDFILQTKILFVRFFLFFFLFFRKSLGPVHQPWDCSTSPAGIKQ